MLGTEWYYDIGLVQHEVMQHIFNYHKVSCKF